MIAAVQVKTFDADPGAFVAEMAAAELSCSAYSTPWAPAARALVIIAGPRQFGNVSKFLTDVWKEVLDSGAAIFLVIAKSEEAKPYQDFVARTTNLLVSDSGLIEESWISVSVAPPRALANAILALRSHRPRKIAVVANPRAVNVRDIVLLERSFNDCHSVVAKALDPGKTARVYLVQAERTPGQWLLPFVAKVGSRRKTAKEYDRFVENVRELVTFSSRPDLAAERCLLGAELGILVSHFIVGSEPLFEAIRRGAPRSLLHSVFDEVLRGWWRRGQQARVISDRPVTAGLEHWYRPEEKDRQASLMRYFRMAKPLGAVSPKAMIEKIEGRASSPHYRSLIHGDLHSENLHVRGNEVFVIDFGAVLEGPILADCAFLEADIVRRFGEEAAKSTRTFAKWKGRLRTCLYPPHWDHSSHAVDDDRPDAVPLDRMCAAIGVVRLHAFGAEINPGDYRAVLAAAFLRLGCFCEQSKSSRHNAVVALLYSHASDLLA